MNAPDLQVGLNFYYEAFLDLTTCRVIGGMGSEGPITWLVIDQYCKANDITGEQREDLFYHISKLDSAYMEHRLQEAKANAKKTGAKNGNT